MALTKILAEEDKIITGITIDGEFYSSDSDKLQNLSVDAFKEMDLEVLPKEEVIETLVVKSEEICYAIADDIKVNGYAHGSQYVEILEWILEVIEIVQSLSPVEIIETSLVRKTLIDLLSYWKEGKHTQEEIPQMIEVMQSLGQYFQLLRMQVHPQEKIEKEALERALNDLLEMLPSISESFQLGQDKVGFEKIHQVVRVLESAVLYLRQNEEEFSSREDEIETLVQTLNALLSDIVVAIEKSDLVLLGDLLEYELPEKLEAYKALVWE
jgi:hypothetical protein